MKIGTPLILLLLAFTLVSCNHSNDINPEAIEVEAVEVEVEAVEVEAEVVEAEVVEEVLTNDQLIKYEAEKLIAQENQEKLNENLVDAELGIISTGQLKGIAAGHDGKGTVTVKDNGDTVIIELSEDFYSDRGPDLYLILTKNQPLEGKDPVQLDTTKILTIAPLVSLSGKQSYEVSKADFEANNYGVAIWCNQFNVLFSGAVLN